MQERSSAEMHDEPPESRQHFDIWNFTTADKDAGAQSYFGAWLGENAGLRFLLDPPESRQHFDILGSDGSRRLASLSSHHTPLRGRCAAPHAVLLAVDACGLTFGSDEAGAAHGELCGDRLASDREP